MADRTVWLLGAGFSQPLGGPLFRDLISKSNERWVRAWTKEHANDPNHAPKDCVRVYEKGVRLGLWSDAEECIALLDRAHGARDGRIPEEVVQTALSESEQSPIPDPKTVDPILGVEPQDLPAVFARMTQFVAIACSHYVRNKPAPLPEQWEPYKDWAKTLSENDTLVTFNYDRVIERLKEDHAFTSPLLKLHGSVPEPEPLAARVAAGEPINEIAVPGPGKMIATQMEFKGDWDSAARALELADALIVVGYSFPASDAFTRGFVLKHCSASRVTIVLGSGPNSDRVQHMFRHLGDKAINTKQYAQTYLTDGTARSRDGRFMHVH